jgi:hypothetical protein
MTTPQTDRAEVIPPQFVGGLEGVTRGELRDAFERVADKTDWKNPVNAEIEIDEGGAGAFRTILEQAIIFYTGTRPTFNVLNREPNGIVKYRVTARGYYLMGAVTFEASHG